MNDPIVRIGDRRDFGAHLWYWTHFVFNWWALFAALIFLVFGFVAGYETSQPDRYGEPTRRMLHRLDDLEEMLVKLRAAELPNIHTEQDKLHRAIEAAQSAHSALPAAQKKRVAPHMEQIVAHGDAIDRALHDQSIEFDGALGGHLKTIRFERDEMMQQIAATDNKASWLFDQWKRFLKWIGAISFLTILTGLLGFLLMMNPDFRRMVAQSSGSISAFGLSLKFSDVESARDSIETRQRALGEDLVRVYTTALRKSGVEAMFRLVYVDLCSAFLDKGVDLRARDHRVTLFVPDFIGEYLVQATRYLGNWRQGDETVVGRRFSVRYGIIGKAWRLIGPQYNSNVRTENKNLIRNWGFTSPEAAPLASSPASASLMAFVINDSGSLPPLAIVYVEVTGNMLHKTENLSDSEAERQEPDADGFTMADRYAEGIWKDVADRKSVTKLKTALIRLQSVLRWNDKVNRGQGQ